MSAPRSALILGGIRSGKTAFGHQLALRTELESGGRVVYVATGYPTDAEMARRIEMHRKSRPDSWRTVEIASPQFEGTMQQIIENAADDEIFLVDSIGEWLSAVLTSLWDDMDRPAIDDRINAEMQELARALSRTRGNCILVAQEVGAALVPENPLGRAFCDLNGLLNQLVAAVAESVWKVQAGIPQKLK